MAKQIEAGKFKVIQCTASEVYTYMGGVGMCDRCGRYQATGYYIAVLNCWYCPDCYRKWIATAQYYPEDEPVERKNFAFYARRLGLKCQ